PFEVRSAINPAEILAQQLPVLDNPALSALIAPLSRLLQQPIKDVFIFHPEQTVSKPRIEFAAEQHGIFLERDFMRIPRSKSADAAIPFALLPLQRTAAASWAAYAEAQ